MQFIFIHFISSKSKPSSSLVAAYAYAIASDSTIADAIHLVSNLFQQS
jgi:hypothetical protein